MLTHYHVSENVFSILLRVNHQIDHVSVSHSQIDHMTDANRET